MFFTCCGKKNETVSEDWTESSKKQIPPNHQTAAQILNDSPELRRNLDRTRTISTSSVSSMKSIQSFYSAKSGDDGDFYSVCSDSSRERY